MKKSMAVWVTDEMEMDKWKARMADTEIECEEYEESEVEKG